MSLRLPAEWEEQDGVLLAWPHDQTDWAPVLPLVEPVFADLGSRITRFETLLVAAPDPTRARACLERAGARPERLRLFRVETDDTWARDFGPIGVLEAGRPVLLDFEFNGWGGKFGADRDNLVTRRLADAGAFGATPVRRPGLVLEGGSIESDGRGTVLTTGRCLLNPGRNPHLGRAGVEEALRRHLGARRVLWLESGHLAGDDTDAHVDTLVRLAPGDALLHVRCDDPRDEHYGELRRMEEELRALRTEEGAPYRLLPLPWPAPRFAADGHRLPATYANFLVVNGAVLVPAYGEPGDEEARRTVARAFPGREAVSVDCAAALVQHGSLHCLTMQIPKGALP